MYSAPTKSLHGNGGLAAGNYPATSAPPDRITVNYALEEQERVLHTLASALQGLEQRLLPVLASPHPNNAGGGEQAPQSLTVLARIEQHNRFVINLGNAVGELTERLEL